jgi:hypothetical protein
MRKTLSLIAAPFAVALLLGCEGPAGPAGATGAAGPEGPAGPAGADQNETCTQCHDDDIRIVVRQLQWGMSKHGSGENVNRATSTTCGICHGHEGFAERAESGFTITAATASTDNPTPINCRTCHEIHTTYTEADFARVTSDPVTMILNGEEIDVGEANICAQCHQPRPRDPFPVIDAVGDFTITSSHWGPHHSVQGGLLKGTGGLEFTGSKSYGVHIHGNLTNNPKGCITCHMAPALGIEAGGHTFAVRYIPEGEAGPEPEVGNEEGCETSGCHESGLNVSDTDLLLFDHNDLRSYVELLVETMVTYMKGQGWLDVDGHVNASSTTPLVVTNNEAAAIWNLLYIEEDHSLGVHNPTYAIALLTNTLEKLGQAVPPRP